MGECFVQGWDNRLPRHKLERTCLEPDSVKRILPSAERKSILDRLLQDPTARIEGKETAIRFLNHEGRRTEIRVLEDGRYDIFVAEKKYPDNQKFLDFAPYSGPMSSHNRGDTYIKFKASGAPYDGQVKAGFLEGFTQEFIPYVVKIDEILQKKK